MIDWFEYSRGTKLIALSVIVAGFLGMAFFGMEGCVYSIVLTLSAEGIWWACK